MLGAKTGLLGGAAGKPAEEVWAKGLDEVDGKGLDSEGADTDAEGTKLLGVEAVEAVGPVGTESGGLCV